MSEIINNVWIDKVATQYVGCNEMEEVNMITGIDPQHEVNYVDLSEFETHRELMNYLTDSNKLFLLKNKQIDYIVFRLDI